MATIKSIEEKAKAYEETLERAKKELDTCGSQDCDAARQIFRFFPELKELEDDKIRKALIWHLTKIDNETPLGAYHSIDGIEISDMLAWLEKQGEQKPADKVEPKFKVGDVVTNKKSKDTVKIVQILHDSYCYSGWDGAATVHSDFSISEQDDWELVEQKTAWSEEDEARFESCIKVLQTSDGYDTINVKWFKSLKDRVLPQPKQEWSEEDIDMIDWLIRCCEKEHEELCNDKYGHQDIVSDLKRDCRKKWNWLESLKNKVVPQNRWKPSDEQMEALKQAKTDACGKPYFNALASLYVNLKGY